MKKTLLLLGVAAIALATILPAAAAPDLPVYSANTLTSTAFGLNGSTATNVAYVITCKKQKTVALQIRNQMSTSSTAVQGVNYSLSVDGVTYTTAITTNVTPVASAQSTTIIPIDTQGAGFIKINFITNAAADTVYATNVVKWAEKIGAP